MHTMDTYSKSKLQEGVEEEEKERWYSIFMAHGIARGKAHLLPSPKKFNYGGGFSRGWRGGPCPPPSLLNSFGGKLEVGCEWPKFGGVKEDFPSNGEDNFYSDVESSYIESNGGDLGNTNGIKYVNHDDTWN